MKYIKANVVGINLRELRINKEADSENIRMRRSRMTREMEYAKCMAVLRTIYRKGSITESEFLYTKGKLKDRFMIMENTNEAA